LSKEAFPGAGFVQQQGPNAFPPQPFALDEMAPKTTIRPHRQLHRNRAKDLPPLLAGDGKCFIRPERPHPTLPRRFRAWQATPIFRAFSLIELLIVVSIISILASIAVPNFLEAQTRSKVARAQADMRTLATAVESYAVDHNGYPPRTPEPGPLNSLRAPDQNFLAKDLSRLTTPVSYLTTLPDDVFKIGNGAFRRENQIIDFWPPADAREFIRTVRSEPQLSIQAGWMMFSLGPDRVFGSFSGTIAEYPVAPSTSFIYDYDPTNGSVSEGNVYRFQFPKEAVRVFRD
jgi:prepilin-type N-terminal cleavage/methylation domain-containing protein